MDNPGGGVFDLSVDQLITKLCKLQLQETQRRAYLVQPETSRDDQCRRLRRKAYDTLFDFLKGRTKYSCLTKPTIVKKEIDGVLSYAYHLRCCRKFDEASRLEDLLESVLDKHVDGSEMRNIILFLVLLAESRKLDSGEIIGHESQRLPLVKSGKMEKVILPSGPAVYGDSRIPTPEATLYMHYPSHVFAATFQNSDIRCPSDVRYPNLFEQMPGSDLSGRGLFNLKPLLNDSHEREARATLFGALVQGRVVSLEAKLELPDLADDSDMKCPEIRIPKAISSSQLSEDEGFNETDMSTSVTTPSVMTLNDSAFEEDIWDLALSYKPSKHYTWERIGCVPCPTERPYITESGSQAVDEWYTLKMKEITLIDPSVVLPPVTEMSQSALIKDILYLLIGVKSLTFKLDKDQQLFIQTPGIYISGMSPDAVENFLEVFIECGTNYHRLCQFAKAPLIDSFYDLGLVYQAYNGAIRKVLQHYRAAILALPTKMSLTYLKFRCDKIFKQIRYLSQLCWCDTLQFKSEGTSFPTGIALLTYLYRETMEAVNTENYPMMLSILQTACGPYTLFIQEWVFHGTYRDVYGEFSIQVNPHYLEYRDKHYWTSGYSLAVDQVEDSVPLFLRDMASDVFICGKTINLLKICSPEHFICQVDDSNIPHVTVTFSERELSMLDKLSQMYVSRMQQIARALTISREQMVERAEQAKRDLMEKAHSVATQEIARLQAKIDEKKKAADMRKRQEFQRLKTQMVTDLHRRASEKEESEETDRAYMAKLMKTEEAKDAKELELEKEAREELFKYYAELSEEAAKREQKALWKIRRSRLETARTEFLTSEADKWAKEMSETAEAKAVLERGAGDLMPVWAKKVLVDPEGAEIVVDDREDALPRWAERGLAAFDAQAESKLQSWTRDPSSVASSNSPTDDSASPGKKTFVKMNASFSTSKESEPIEEKKSVRVFEEAHSTKESEAPAEAKPHVKLMPSMHATTETSPDEEFRPSVKVSEDAHASKETDSAEQKPHTKPVADIHVGLQSTATEDLPAPKLKRQDDVHANLQTQSKEWKIKQQSVFGHVSKLSGSEYELMAPKLKKREEIYANLESDMRDFSIRPKIRISSTMSVNKESETPESFRSQIRINKEKHVSVQSEFIDQDELRLKKFKIRNVHGHSSDSTVQRLLYGETYGSPERQANRMDVADASSEVFYLSKAPDSEWLDQVFETYDDSFDQLNETPMVDLMAFTPIAYGGFGDYGMSQGEDVDAYKYMPLPALLQKSMTASIQAQCCLVNKCIRDYFFGELKIQSHFEALRRFLFMGDGDFAQILSDILLDKLSLNPLPQEILNPIFLNGALTKALQSSMHSEDKYADNLSFALKYSPAVFRPNAHDTLDCLELRYKVEWPLNIVLTDSCMNKYSRIFSFMLQLKRLVWVLKDIWHRLKRDALINKAGNSPQFRQLQLHRQEMQHFVKVMQGYISNQILLLTWSEFLHAIDSDVSNIDDLHYVHAQYLEKAIFRSLLNKKAAPVMKIIQDIFCLILKFRTQLISAPWLVDPEQGQTIHPNFNQMVTSYQAFREYSFFLFKVVNKLAIRGYQPHLQELLLRLNFNSYYDSKT